MKKIILGIGVCAVLLQPAKGERNCCGGCSYNQADAVCTKNCCVDGTTESAPDANHIILVTTNKLTVTCATTSTGSNLVYCNKTYSCKCEKGYYGVVQTDRFNLDGGCSGTCTRCPSSGGVYGTTASSGATSITECYIPSGTSFNDTTGTGTYTGNCPYVE